MDNSARVEENPPCFVDGNYQFQEFHTIGSDGEIILPQIRLLNPVSASYFT